MGTRKTWTWIWLCAGAALGLVTIAYMWYLAIPNPPGAVCTVQLPAPPGCSDERLLPVSVWTGIIVLGYGIVLAATLASKEHRERVAFLGAVLIGVLCLAGCQGALYGTII